MDSFNIIPLFAVPFYHSQIDIDYGSKINLKSLEFERLKINNGFISKEKYVLEQTYFLDLKKKILNHVESFTRKVLNVDSCVEFYITNSWVMKHHAGDWSQKHNHKNSLLSGIVYLETTDQSGNFRIHKSFQTVFPNNLDPKVVDFNPFNSEYCDFIPKVNDIFIFPSQLEHEVTESKSKDERYCLAFNVFAKGIFGNNRDVAIESLFLR